MTDKVEEIIKKAIIRFSNEANVEIKQTSLIIKNENENSPTYHKLINNICERNEDGSLYKLKFGKDILGKIDILFQGKIVGSFINSFFIREGKAHDYTVKDLFVRMELKAENEKVKMALFYKNKFVRMITYNELISI